MNKRQEEITREFKRKEKEFDEKVKKIDRKILEYFLIISLSILTTIFVNVYLIK